MALSNIFREPRREITESAIGVTVFGAAVWVDYLFASWLQDYAGCERTDSEGGCWHYMPWPFGMITGAIVVAVAVVVLLFTHDLGDAICNSLDRRGIRLRPRTRR